MISEDTPVRVGAEAGRIAQEKVMAERKALEEKQAQERAEAEKIAKE